MAGLIGIVSASSGQVASVREDAIPFLKFPFIGGALMARRRAPKAHGQRIWYIPDGYLPPLTPGQTDLVSHESLCLLNPSTQEAHVTLTVYFEDREPIRGISLTVPPERTWHVRLDKPEHLGGHVLPRGVPYALRVESDVPIIVQLSRMDVTQPNLALMTTMGYPAA